MFFKQQIERLLVELELHTITYFIVIMKTIIHFYWQHLWESNANRHDWNVFDDPNQMSVSGACISNYMSLMFVILGYYINGLVQNCSNSTTNILELLQSCTKPSICSDFTIDMVIAILFCGYQYLQKHISSVIYIPFFGNNMVLPISKY